MAPSNEDVFTREALLAVEWLTEQSWQTPYSIRVDSLTNFQHSRAERDELMVADLVSGAAELSEPAISAVKTIALGEPQLVRRLVSERGHVAGVHITVQLPGEQPAGETNEVAAFARALAARAGQRFPDIDVYLSGTVIMDMTFEDASSGDLQTLIPAMYCLTLVLLGLLLRSIAATLSTLLLIACVTAGAMGVAGWMRIDLTSPAAIAPVIILTLAVADSVHFLSTMLQQMRGNGQNKKLAIVTSLEINFLPILLTSLTTAIGFLTLNFGEVPPFADMGNIVAAGVVLAFLWSVTVLPALMAVLPVSAKIQAGFPGPGRRRPGRVRDQPAPAAALGRRNHRRRVHRAGPAQRTQRRVSTLL